MTALRRAARGDAARARHETGCADAAACQVLALVIRLFDAADATVGPNDQRSAFDVHQLRRASAVDRGVVGRQLRLAARKRRVHVLDALIDDVGSVGCRRGIGSIGGRARRRRGLAGRWFDGAAARDDGESNSKGYEVSGHHAP